MAVKKTHTKHTKPVHHRHSPHRPARIREILITLIFGSLILIFITLSLVNTSSGY